MNLVIDANNLAMREAYSKAGLSHKGKPTGVIFGVVQQLLILGRKYPGEVYFCWDSKESVRQQFWEGYKSGRRNGGDAPEQAQDAYPQMEELRQYILPRLGFPNHSQQEGYEADDLVAAICQRIGHYVIVSSDNDLWQCLGPSIKIFRIGKKEEFTYRDFHNEYGIAPRQWIEVKALAGDSSDSIPGVPGIGIKTAVKYVQGQRVGKNLIFKILEHEGIIQRNRQLVTLPWKGTNPGPSLMSKFNIKEFQQVCDEYGLESLRRKI